MKWTLVIGVAWLMASCATVSFNTPNNRFLTPENSGDTFSGRIGYGYGSKSKVILVENLATDNPTADKPKVQLTDGSSGFAEMSLIPVLDVFYGPSGPGLKAQIWGDPASEATAGNFSVAVAAAREYASNSETDTFSSGSVYTNEGKARYKLTDLMVLVGYRKSDSRLVYLNIANNFMEATGRITKSTTTGGTTTTTTTSIPTQKGRETSVLLGYQMSSDSLYFILEPGYSRIEWQNTPTRERFTFGASAGFLW